MLQPKKSAAELILEKKMLHTQQSNALAAKQVEYDQMLASAQAVAEEMHVIRESVLALEGELQALRTEPVQPGPPPQPRPEHVQVPKRITG